MISDSHGSGVKSTELKGFHLFASKKFKLCLNNVLMEQCRKRNQQIDGRSDILYDIEIYYMSRQTNGIFVYFELNILTYGNFYLLQVIEQIIIECGQRNSDAHRNFIQQLCNFFKIKGNDMDIGGLNQHELKTVTSKTNAIKSRSDRGGTVVIGMKRMSIRKSVEKTKSSRMDETIAATIVNAPIKNPVAPQAYN